MPDDISEKRCGCCDEYKKDKNSNEIFTSCFHVSYDSKLTDALHKKLCIREFKKIKNTRLLIKPGVFKVSI
jgi:hypothetical protein